jgi:hypothetical protein
VCISYTHMCHIPRSSDLQQFYGAKIFGEVCRLKQICLFLPLEGLCGRRILILDARWI